MSVKELLQSGDCGKEVEVKGWVRTKRGNKQVNFIALNDGSTINNIQVVVDMEKVAEEVMKKVTTGAAIHVKDCSWKVPVVGRLVRFKRRR